MLNLKERIDNVIDELNRASSRIKELGDFEEHTITSDAELVSDMEASIERMQEVYDIVGLSLIIAGNLGFYSDKLFAHNIEFDSVEMRQNCLKWAMDILPQCQSDNWEDYYDTTWRKVTEEVDKLCKGGMKNE